MSKPTERYTTHKPRSIWFAQRSCYPRRDANPSAMERRMLEHPGLPPTWEAVGPMNIAGRVTAVAIHPKNRILFAGTAAGGVWRSKDFGKTWQEPSNFLYLPADQPHQGFGGHVSWPSGNIGALAINPSDPSHVYCATGEANLSADSYPGCGLFHSPDNGDHWYPLSLPTGFPDALSNENLPRRVGAIAVDPFDPQHIRIGGVTHSDIDPAGMFFSRDGGKTWDVEPLAKRNYYCHAVLFHPKRKGVIFAVADVRGAASPLWKSDDAGKTWKQLGSHKQAKRSLPPGYMFGRTSIAIAPSAPDTIYAYAGDRKSRVLGVFRSDDLGDSWRRIDHGPLFREESQMSYTNTIAVHPRNRDFVVCGGLDLLISEDSGKQWRRATRWDEDPPAGPRYAHGDHHALAILPNGWIIDGNDGGIAVSQDAGKSWEMRNQGMNTTMFYDIDVAPTNSNCMGGGTQDNGTLLRDTTDKPGQFRKVIHGDGAWMVYDHMDEENIFGSYHEVHLFRHLRKGGGGWLKSGGGDKWHDVSPNMTREERKSRAIAVMVIDPVCKRGKKTVWVGTKRLWRTLDAGRSWKPTSPVFDDSAISAIEVADANSKLIFVGTTNGGLYRSLDGGKTWSENLAGPEVPPRLISRIDTHVHPETGVSRVLITLAGSGVGKFLIERGSSGAFLDRGYSHIFLSEDDGITWIDLDRGSLPDLAYHAAVFETQPPYRAFVGGDYGVFMLQRSPQGKDDNYEWVTISGNLPHVIVSDLVYHHEDHILTAATYGRGIWRLKLDEAGWKALGT